MSDPKSAERSYFSPGSRIEGNLEIEGEVTLQGQITGKVVGTGLVTVGEHANVRANIHAPVVVVEGTLRGEIHARDRLELHRTAKVQGVIRAPRIRIDEGAFFDGECRMAPSEAKEAARPEPTRLEERRPAETRPAPSTPVAGPSSEKSAVQH